MILWLNDDFEFSTGIPWACQLVRKSEGFWLWNSFRLFLNRSFRTNANRIIKKIKRYCTQSEFDHFAHTLDKHFSAHYHSHRHHITTFYSTLCIDTVSKQQANQKLSLLCDEDLIVCVCDCRMCRFIKKKRFVSSEVGVGRCLFVCLALMRKEEKTKTNQRWGKKNINTNYFKFITCEKMRRGFFLNCCCIEKSFRLFVFVYGRWCDFCLAIYCINYVK